MANARFVSRYGNYQVGVQNEILEHYGTGEAKVLQKRIDAQFRRTLLDADAFAVAVASFQFPGLPEDFETNTNVSPRSRCSVWDSEWSRSNEGFTDDEIDKIIEKLRATAGADHVELAPVAAKEPFPNFDLLDPAKAIEVIRTLNLDPEAVAEYERENQNREELLALLLGDDMREAEVVIEA